MKTLPFFAKLRNSRTKRFICAFLALNIIIEIASPTVAMALTAGASSPEFTSFEPVATTDMVNDFSGDFTYNIPVLNVPGPDGAGYSMSLAYHSGSSSEEEASWVGFGWTLNPGAINRNKRGYPDEFNGVTVVKYNKQKPNWTQSAKFDLNLEIQSNDKKKKKDDKAGSKESTKAATKIFAGIGKGPGGGGNDGSDEAEISLSFSHSIRYNNYSGFSIANGFGVGVMGMANLSMNRSGGQNTFGFSVNPLAIMKGLAKKKMDKLKKENKKHFLDKLSKFSLWNGKKEKPKTSGSAKTNALASSYSFHSVEAPTISYSVGEHAGASWNFSASVELNVNIPVGIQIGVAGNMNIQAQDGVADKYAYGYMNSCNKNLGDEEDEVHDYQIEKETTFNKHDKNIGIPFNNADVFSATGNNVTGGFKLYHQKIGTYFPNNSESTIKIRQFGVELGIGATIQIGFDIGIGKQKTEVKGLWPKTSSALGYSTSKPMMRFQGDMGGEMKYDGNYGELLGAQVKQNKTPDHITYLELDAAKKSSSSYIKYNQATSTTNPSIESIEITNKDGGKSNYGLPTYTRKELELSVGLDVNEDGKYLVTKNDLYTYDPMKNKTVVGQFTDDKYASAYLLTSNTTFNYLDADAIPGVSDGDFGGWTKFGYREVYGETSGVWYRYRSPYAGLNYNDGRMLDQRDQTGSMSSGEKAVHYLKCIETKSHIAFFVTNNMTSSTFTTNFPVNQYPFLYDNTGTAISSVTAALQGSGSPRYDGLDAAPISGGVDLAAQSLSNKGTHELEKLERIVLFAKADVTKPLTTTYFQYDFSLCQGIPNSNASTSAPAKDKGKLTLKSVWTESGGASVSKISPYQFDYEYFHQYPTSILNEVNGDGSPKYPWAQDYNTNYLTNDPAQNPLYKPEHLDIWGFYQENGNVRFKNMQTWLSQKAPVTNFDPAAWQLKRIKLPSGGEIHVQYEQKDYTSVQDQNPMAMVSLIDDSTKDDYTSDKSVFRVNTSDIAVTDIPAYANKLQSFFVAQKNKLYFKVLYSMVENAIPNINKGSTKSQYVTGYVTVHKVVEDAGKIYLHLGDTRDSGKGKKDKTLPRWVCYQELLTNGGLNLGLDAPGNYEDDDDLFTSIAYKPNATNLDEQDFVDMSRQHVLSNTIDMFKGWVESKVKNVKKADACQTINFSLSYFKLPTQNAKKGGGIRVKRLLTYDAGISGEINGDATIYGTEYCYVNEDGTSSGVATNEPSQGREENALVGILERKKQKFFSKITNGRDTKQFEGPLGESVMPSASVSHSRVVIKNIHSGKTSTGYVINKYHTVKEFPFDVEFSDLSKEKGTYRKFNLSLPLGLFNLNMNRAWITQGYLFKENDMHGKIASKATYAGNYDANTFNETAFTSKTSYNYTKPGTSIPALLFDSGSDSFTKEMLNPGNEEDITMFSSSVKEKTNDFSIEIDLNVQSVPTYVSLGLGFSYSYSEQLLCQHVTSKIVNYKSYLLSTTNITDGVTQTTENLAFDRNTGDPVLTRTFDGFMAPNEKINTEKPGTGKHSGYYYSLNIPAAWMYPNMGAKTAAVADKDKTNQLTAVAGNVVTYGSNALYDYMLAPTPSSVNTNWSPVTNPLTNVVSASATTYTNQWFPSGSDVVAEYTISATAVTALNKFYYPVKTYAYRDNVTDANDATTKIYSGGLANTVAGNAFKFFNWLTPASNTAVWYSDGTITRYSPYGYPVEEVDVLGIISSAKFGYNNTLPVSVVQNAKYNETKFIDFEYGFAPTNVTSQFAHSGRACFDLSSNLNYAFVNNYPISVDMIAKKGLGVKFWLKSSLSNVSSSSNYGLKNPNPQVKIMIGSQPFNCIMVAQTGEWALYSVDIKNFNAVVQGNYNISISYNKAINEMVLVDDFRIQPLDASMNCSVYANDYKVAAQFDDQHFGVFYEYNTKGQLVRKSIETERGKKTLQEQQYNTPLIIKN